jgi:NAD(P)H-dependent FMN reductase
VDVELRIIIGSTRPGRIGPVVGDWVDQVAREHGAFDVTLVDLASFELPLLDEPSHPAKQDYQHEHTKRWSAAVQPADAYVFVTPEYDFFAPASLVNAIQCVLKEWKYKPAAVVSYGGQSGGFRSTQELRTLLANVGVMPLPESIALRFVHSMVDDGELKVSEGTTKAAHGMLDELHKWAEALATLRA